MKLFAISDLHLAFQVDKPMDIFGPSWENHHEKLETFWKDSVSNEDTVIIGGDISWALKLEEAKLDLDFIHSLPGKKIIFKGNHDYWWESYSKVKRVLPESIEAIQNNFFPFDREKSIAICGTRGWQVPLTDDKSYKQNNEQFSEQQEHNKKIFNRELHRLELSMNAAIDEGFENLIVTLHYPPFYKHNPCSQFAELMEKYNVKICLYGHLHGKDHENAFVGVKNNISYNFIAGDYLDFKPLKIDLSILQ
ncbi:metallophosphoesterase [Natranaerobius thermophilus]|uniref:Metallophosphoesterase n=1 Tax=Natranaerobius thermophilus (strain ATCC BAA-1301 / DSM 18059 / JW/NM-WN-LF) TaxID=457570 RepID=B2A0M8_NATTJ|nr:metallophosphoesterase [Natranaerobius thermophilus]ACB84586.1 metallophosphoesterase [Natranaerobius thermophilus JW/NM-WN-LF]